MYKFLLGLLLLLFSVTCFAQETTSKKKIRYHKRMKILSREQINQLKGGALLVRLQTKKKSVEALRKIGKDKLADKIEREQKNYNLEIIEAFKNNFSFCPAYFFFNDYSNYVKNKQFDSVVFLNDSLRPDTSLKFNFKSFLTAEFGTIEQDTLKSYSGYSWERDTSGNLQQAAHYYGQPNMSFGALIIKSDIFIQLYRPFPYYVRTFDSLFIERSPNTVVRKMNRKLTGFYKTRAFKFTVAMDPTD